MTHEQVLHLALDGTETERQLAREVLEERGERYAINRRLIDALHRIEALEKAATPAPEAPSVATSWKPLSFSDGTGVPREPCICGKPLCMVPPYPPCPVHGQRPHTIVTASCWLPPKEAE